MAKQPPKQSTKEPMMSIPVAQWEALNRQYDTALRLNGEANVMIATLRQENARLHTERGNQP